MSLVFWLSFFTGRLIKSEQDEIREEQERKEKASDKEIEDMFLKQGNIEMAEKWKKACEGKL